MDCYDFVAVDFETATNRYDSACSIGLAAVKNGEIADTFYSLIKPPNLEFSENNIKIHGITPDMVKESPTLDDLWKVGICRFFGPSLIIAHNAHFDMSVLKQSLCYYDVPNFKYVDSTSIAKDFVPGPKSLQNCAEFLGINMGKHHNALDDAITCAKIVLTCLNMSGLDNIGQLCFSRENVKINDYFGLNSQESYQNHAKKAKNKFYQRIAAKDIFPQTAEFDKEHPLYQKFVLFTGDFPVDRSELMQRVANVGGLLKDSISRKINYLVVGKVDVEYMDENGLSKKERVAKELNESGKAHIEIIDFDRFLSLLSGEIEN